MLDERKNLGKNLKRHREYRGLSRDELGNKVDLTGTHIARIERAEKKYTKNLGLGYLLDICKVLDTTPEELFMKDSNLLTLRFVISEHNISTLKEVVNIIKDLIERKEE